MTAGSYPQGLLIAAALVGLAIAFTVSVLLQWFRMRRSIGGPEPDPDPASVFRTAAEDPPPEPSAREILQRVEDVLAARLGHQTEISLESERRIKSELIEVGCKLDVLADACRQNSKELAVVEQLLRDVIQILNISISETKGLSKKVQSHLEDPLRVAQAIVQRSGQLR